MIRFSAALVVVAVAVLVGGVVTSTLLLVYVAIILSAAALIALAIGVAVKRDELFGGTGRPVGDVMGAFGGQSSFARQPGAPGAQPVGGLARPGQGFVGDSGNVTAYGATATPPAPPNAPSTSARPNAPLPAAPRPGVTETRADMTALGADTSRAEDVARAAGTGPARKPDAGQTRTDMPAVRDDQAGGPASRSRGVAETRLDMSPVLAEGDLGGKVVPSRPAPGGTAPGGNAAGAAGAPGAARPRADETRSDMPAVGREPRSGGGSQTRFDLPAQQPGQPATARPLTDDSQVAIIPGVPRYHAPNCILIRFMDEEDLEKKTLAEAKAAGCTPCTACQTDAD